jgi:hypothetical protein
MYLDGERSARDPRFDLKVFQYVPSFFLLSYMSFESSSPSRLLPFSPFHETVPRHLALSSDCDAKETTDD